MVLYPNKLPESERVCSGICNVSLPGNVRFLAEKRRFSLRETYGSGKGNVKNEVKTSP